MTLVEFATMECVDLPSGFVLVQAGGAGESRTMLLLYWKADFLSLRASPPVGLNNLLLVARPLYGRVKCS